MAHTATSQLRIDANRLSSRILGLADLGTTRLAFSEEDRRGRALTMDMMRAAGLVVSVDAASNIIGRRPGLTPGPTILTGSHVDTVRNGGRFDGVLGCVAAIEVLHTLEEASHVTRHPLEVVTFTNEEGQIYAGLAGSRAMVGALTRDDLAERNATGCTLAEAIAEWGGEPARLDDARREPGDLLAYVELHVEQGGVLEQRGVSIGVVQGIVTLLQVEVIARGAARHSGTTPMSLRHDALVAAARFITTVDEEIRSGTLCHVGTVGRLDVSPNSPNIVPGEVRLTLELRDLGDAAVDRALDRLRTRAGEIALACGVELAFLEPRRFPAAAAAPTVIAAITRAANQLGLASYTMPSGAGHDAQMLARIAPMGMIFVPSAGGISHAEDEFTSDTDCANGANVLLRTILELDASEP